MEEASFRERVSRLDISRARVYAVGCATHAKDHILGEKGSKVDRPLETVAKLLDTFWSLCPQSLRDAALAPLVVQIDVLTPVEGVPEYEPGTGQLIWSVAYAFSIAQKKECDEDAVLTTEASAWNAYEAVFSFHHEQGQTYPGEEEIRELEMNSVACQAEIEFQLAFLGALEASQGQPPPYATILQQMSSGH
jgi:hypothetical protein